MVVLFLAENYRIGIYPIQMACLLFKHEKPLKITASGHLMSTGVDECCSITLLYTNQRIAQINISTNCATHAPTFIIGDKGIMQVVRYTCQLTVLVRTIVIAGIPAIFSPNFPRNSGYPAEFTRMIEICIFQKFGLS
jgi:predicted dehydrogenase